MHSSTTAALHTAKSTWQQLQRQLVEVPLLSLKWVLSKATS
jgi:hypothetical protein